MNLQESQEVPLIFISFLMGSETSCSEIKDTVFQLYVPPKHDLTLESLH